MIDELRARNFTLENRGQSKTERKAVRQQLQINRDRGITNNEQQAVRANEDCTLILNTLDTLGL